MMIDELDTRDERVQHYLYLYLSLLTICHYLYLYLSFGLGGAYPEVGRVVLKWAGA